MAELSRSKKANYLNNRNKLIRKCNLQTLQDFMPIYVFPEEGRLKMSLSKKGIQTTSTLGKPRPPHIKAILKKYAYTSESVKGDKKYLFALMDDETRYWIAKEISDKKEGHDATGLFREAKKVTKTIPKLMITDGLQSYKEAFNKEFFTQKGIRSVHLRHIRMSGDMNNNKMERMNGEFRDREKVARGLKKDDSPLINGYQIFHNYIRPHMALDGKTPSEACGITIQGDDKWKTLIQRASL